MANPNIRIKRSAVPGKQPTVNDLPLGELGLNTYDAELYARRERTGIGTDIVRLGAGATVTNILYVTSDGIDSNTGKKLGDAKRTIGAALTAATTGTVIKVSAGSYVENNPLSIPEQVSIVGDSLREVSVIPQNTNQDLFYVTNGNYVAEMSYTGTLDAGKAIFAFNPVGAGTITQSPYIQNCTNFIPNSIGMKIDGNNALGNTKSMVLDSYTQYNQGGIGVSITNNGYAQLVSLFTICNDIAVYCGSGGACDLTNSNSSFGNYGLVADGVSNLQFTGIVTTSGGTRLIISVGGNTLSGTLAEFNAALTDGDFATQSYVATAVSNLLDSAPETLNTLNELAAAINDDASYAATITTALGNKAPIASPTFTGTVGGITKDMVGLSNVDNTSDNTKALITYIPVSSVTRTISSATDKNTLIECSVACTITIPNDTQDAGWPIGSMVEVRQIGTGQVTITKDAAVTMQGTDSQFKTRVQWSTIMLEKRSANSWLVTGDTTA